MASRFSLARSLQRVSGCSVAYTGTKEIHLIVNIQRQRLARDRVAMTTVLDWNEVGVVARHEGDGARGIWAVELGETPLIIG